MSKLYEELRDIAMQDGTVYAYLQKQSINHLDELDVAIALIQQLVVEKNAYFDDAINTRNLSIVPMLLSDDSGYKDEKARYRKITK